MPKQTVYKGRPCYIRQAVYIEYLDAELPYSDTIVVIDENEQGKIIYSDVEKIELTPNVRP